MAKITLDRRRHSYLPDPQRPEDWALKEMTQELQDGGAYALLGPSAAFHQRAEADHAAHAVEGLLPQEEEGTPHEARLLRED